MEKKTIGSFIATLRKANGMTQKELADKLNVSDKTVSRWECEEGFPDLSVIPVIAEIFGVSCDELLRGERRSKEECSDVSHNDSLSQKSEKQRKRLLAVSLSNYKTRSYIAMGCSLIGLIAAMICNFGFLRAYVGFFIGIIFYLISIIFQTIVMNQFFLAVSDDTFNMIETETGTFRWKAVMQAEWSYGLTAAVFGFTLPLIAMTGKSMVGLNADYWFVFGSLAAAVTLLIFAVICYYLNAALLKRETYSLSERETRIYSFNHRLKARCVAGLTALLIITLIIHAFGSEMIWSTSMLSKGTTFHDYESFIAYMEQDIAYQPPRNNSLFMADVQVAVPQNSVMASAPAQEEGEQVWYDAQGNIVNEDEANRRIIEDINGNVVCTYIRRNESVTSISYIPKDGTVLPITVKTYEEQRVARNLSEAISIGYCILYPIEIFAVLVIYLRKRMRK